MSQRRDKYVYALLPKWLNPSWRKEYCQIHQDATAEVLCVICFDPVCNVRYDIVIIISGCWGSSHWLDPLSMCLMHQGFFCHVQNHQRDIIKPVCWCFKCESECMGEFSCALSQWKVLLNTENWPINMNEGWRAWWMFCSISLMWYAVLIVWFHDKDNKGKVCLSCNKT